MRTILETLFQKLDQAQITYCLMRDADQLEKISPKMEIDLLVDSQQIEAFQDLMVELGFVYLDDWGYFPHRFFLYYDEEYNYWLKIDVVTKISFGKPIPSLVTTFGEKCLRNRQRSGSFYTPSAQDEFIALLLHSLLDKRLFTPSRRQRIRILLDRIKSDFYTTKKLAAYFPDPKNWNKVESLVRAEKWDELIIDRQTISNYILPGSKVTTIVLGIWLSSLRKLNRIRRFVKPVTPSLALMAPDGAGKSTLANGLKDNSYFPITTFYMGLYQKQNKASSKKLVPGLNLLIKLAKIWRNYISARYKQAQGHVVIFDRFIYDALLPSQHPLSLGRKLSRWLVSHSCPPPDLIILLDAPGEILFSRKGEHNPSFLENQRQAYNALKSQLPNVITIDATQSKELNQKTILSLLWKFIRGRQAGINSNQIVEGWIEKSEIKSNQYPYNIEPNAEITQ